MQRLYKLIVLLTTLRPIFVGHEEDRNFCSQFHSRFSHDMKKWFLYTRLQASKSVFMCQKGDKLDVWFCASTIASIKKARDKVSGFLFLVAEAGLEPTTFGL